MNRGKRVRAGQRLALLPLLLIGSAAVSSVAVGQTPAAEVPTALQGEWEVSVDGKSALKAQFAAASATLLSPDGKVLAYIEGKFAQDAPMDLKAWLTQGAISPPVPDKAWKGAVAERGKPDLPGLFGTQVTLAYIQNKDAIEGKYFEPDIRYDPDSNDYKKTELTEKRIALTRPAERVAPGARDDEVP